MEFTPNLNLPKPSDLEDGWGDEMRTAMDTLDALILAPEDVMFASFRYRYPPEQLSGVYDWNANNAEVAQLSGDGGLHYHFIDMTLHPTDSASSRFHDPNGWLNPDAVPEGEADWWDGSGDLPANTTLKLPPGIYHINYVVAVDTSTTPSWQVNLDHISDAEFMADPLREVYLIDGPMPELWEHTSTLRVAKRHLDLQVTSSTAFTRYLTAARYLNSAPGVLYMFALVLTKEGSR